MPNNLLFEFLLLFNFPFFYPNSRVILQQNRWLLVAQASSAFLLFNNFLKTALEGLQ